MKVLFVNSNLEKDPWPVIPLGMCLVASNLKKHKRRFLDLVFEKNPEKKLKQTLKQSSPDFVCVGIRNIDNCDFSSPEFYLKQVKEKIINTIKNNSNAKIIIGGSAVNISPKQITKYLEVNYGIYGEGEQALNTLIDNIIKNKSLNKTPGAIYKDKQGEIQVNPVARVKDLNKILPAMPYKWVDVKKYLGLASRINIQTKRGCCLNCSYCVYNKIEGAQIRYRSPKLITDEIQDIIEKTKIKDFEFTDSVFNVPLEHSKNICKEIIKRKIKANLSTMGINPSQVTPELIQLLEQAGFNEISITPESASNKVLKGLNKNFTKKQIEKAAELLGKSKLNVIWYFMFGGPGETKQTVKETLEFIKNKVPKHHLILAVGAIRIFNGTQIEQLALKEKQIQNQASLEPCFYHSKNASPEYIKKQIQWMRNNLPNFIALEDNKVRGFQRFLLRIVKTFQNIINNNTPIWVYLIKIKKLQQTIKPKKPKLSQKKQAK